MMDWDHDRMVEALSSLGGADVSFFIWGKGDEPEGDVYLASDEFVDLLAEAYKEAERV